MSIQNFPAALQPIIQQGFLARGFQEGLRSRLSFRSIADRMPIPNRVGETITMTRRGLKAPVTTPLTPASNTNFDNGLTPSSFGVEQYTLTMNIFGDTIDLNTVTEQVGIANLFVANARTNGVQATQSLDRLARDALYGGKNVFGLGGYLGGNTRVRTALSAAGTSVSVDDIRGFQNTLTTSGTVISIAGSAGMLVVVGSGTYTLLAAVADGTNVSTAPGGISGVLTFSTNVSTSDGAAGNAVIASTAPLIIRPNARATTAALIASQGTYGSASYVPGDTMTLDTVNQAVAALRMNNVPPVDESGLYHCYLDDQQLLGLFRDGDFKQLYRGAYNSETYRTGQVVEILGVRYIPTTEAPQQASLGAGRIHRAIVVGQGALVEGDFVGMAATDAIPDAEKALIEMVDDVVMVTREPQDRLKQIIAQSWYWIGGYALPTDATATPNIIPTATNSYLKRGVVIESL
ncbi:DUF4043 domain-containing protein [Acetobacteraceae bacterium KSS8]|uniref:DUF4043 domain-containing protein n=1 Tax=Endosaccharibacter trunci TaxID=2812733 RepID=A0ABT1WC77_9PROT|nr:DUF4043 domain-containing protein [Acetobacteraceae bacterium KSS8]